MLGFFEREIERLDDRRALREPELAPLGLLMRIPRPNAPVDGHGQ